MEQKDLDQIQQTAEALMKVIKQATGREALVAWGNLSEEGIATGITFSENLTAQDVESICFRLVGRTYGLIDYENIDE